MAKYDIYGPFSGVKSAISLLELMDDPKMRDGFLQTLRGLEAEREKVNKAIAVYGEARKIDGLVAQARQDAQAAAKTLNDAKAVAEEIMADTKLVTGREDRRIADLKKVLDEHEERLQIGETRFKADLAASETAMAERETAVSSREAAAEQRYRDGSELKERYGKALAAIKAVEVAA